VKNWAEYDRALVKRGDLTIWFDEASIAESWTPPRPVGRGKPGLYSDVAIQTCLTLKTLFRLPYRATEGLLKSLMRLCGLHLPVPDHTHMSRRAATLEVKIPRRPRTGATHVVVDSTGLKIFGEGEWKVRQHGVGKRRTWRKIHLAVDASVMYRLKQLGDRLFSREFDRQVAESHVRAAIINQFVCLGMPQSVRIGQIALRRRKRRTLIAHTAALQRHHAVPAGLTFVTAASLGCASRQVKIGRQSLAGQRRLVRQTVKTLKPTGESLAITERALRHARAQLGA